MFSLHFHNLIIVFVIGKLNAICESNMTTRSCKCKSGYTGLQCETNINECSSNPCINNG